MLLFTKGGAFWNGYKYEVIFCVALVKHMWVFFSASCSNYYASSNSSNVIKTLNVCKKLMFQEKEVT
jgi:hypothetical protein